MSSDDILAFLNEAATRRLVRDILRRTVGTVADELTTVSIDDTDILKEIIHFGEPSWH